jgi:hypothetical protein
MRYEAIKILSLKVAEETLKNINIEIKVDPVLEVETNIQNMEGTSALFCIKMFIEFRYHLGISNFLNVVQIMWRIRGRS